MQPSLVGNFAQKRHDLVRSAQEEFYGLEFITHDQAEREASDISMKM